MPLIKCPECNKEISDRAEKCPGCGYPLFRSQNNKREESRNKKENSKLIRGLNIALGIVGLLMLLGVLSSKGGIDGNRNAAIVSWGILMAVIVGLLAIKIKNKILAFCTVIPYAIALLSCTDSIKISSAYLLLEAFIGVTALFTFRHMKKYKII